MDDLSALERQIEGQLNSFVGPVLPVDDAAIFNDITAASRSRRWGFTMFSALKFVAAGVIVALFGGFVLAGLFTTQQDEMVPAAVTESPSPVTSDELLSGMVTEEVEPGVLRVLYDGAGHPMGADDPTDFNRLYVGPDGAVWVIALVSDAPNPVMWQLGVPGRHEQSPEGGFSEPFDFATAPDGTLWVAGYAYLSSYDGVSWTEYRVAKEPSREWPPSATAVEVLPDGTVWAAWEDRLGRLDAEGWHYYYPTMGEDEWLSELHVLPDGSILAITWHGRILRFDGAAWQEVPMPDVDAATRVTGVRVGFDGTLWMHFISRSTAPEGPWWGSRWWDSDEVPQDHLAHYDGETWTTYSAADGLPRLTHALKQEPSWDVHPDGSVWVLADPEQAMESDPYSLLWTLRSFDGDTWTEWSDGVGMLHATAMSLDGDTRTEWTEGMGMLDIGPDGTVWMGRPDPGDAERLYLASFDGTTWRQYPRFDAWQGSLAFSPDGSAWVVADADRGLYVITPEAVAK